MARKKPSTKSKTTRTARTARSHLSKAANDLAKKGIPAIKKDTVSYKKAVYHVVVTGPGLVKVTGILVAVSESSVVLLERKHGSSKRLYKVYPKKDISMINGEVGEIGELVVHTLTAPVFDFKGVIVGDKNGVLLVKNTVTGEIHHIDLSGEATVTMIADASDPSKKGGSASGRGRTASKRGSSRKKRAPVDDEDDF